MLHDLHISVVIPALNEEQAIGKVITELQTLKKGQQCIIDDIVVCDNGSTDKTAAVARNLGAQVVYQAQAGYGIACLTAIKHLKHTDIILFIDSDHSCITHQALRLLVPLANDPSLDLVIGSRTLGSVESGAVTLPQKFGTLLAAQLIRWIWKKRVTDLGPFRAIRASALATLNMQDTAYGWTVEMQVKAIQHDLSIKEVAVDSICRIGQSKISGTIKGVLGAGKGILSMIAKLWWQQKKHPNNYAIFTKSYITKK